MKKRILVFLLTIILAVAMVIPMAIPVAANGGPVLAARWNFDEGTGIVANDMTTINNGNLSFGNALQFDGSDDYVQVGDIGATADWTVQFWANFTGSGGTIYYPISLSTPSPTWSGGVFIAYSGNNWGIYDGNIWVMQSPIIVNTWHHYAVTKNGLNYAMYLDGVAGPSGPLGDIDINNLVFGKRGDNYWNFPGIIDEVKISNVALTSFNIVSPPMKDANTIGLWHFDEGTGQIAGDSANIPHNGQLGPTSGADAEDPTWIKSPLGPTWIAGQNATYGGALNFDGKNDYVTVADNSTLKPASITVELWVRHVGSPGSYKYIVSKYWIAASGDRASYGLYTGGTGNLYFYVSDASGYKLSPVAAGVWNGDWHHVAGTYDASTNEIKLYVDKVLVSGSPTTGVDNIGYDAGSLFIGTYRYPETTYSPTFTMYAGDLDEVRIWGNVLSVGQLDDMTAPSISASAKNADNSVYTAGTWTNQDVTVHYTASDSGSGLASVTGDQTFSSTTASTSGTAIDYALNSATASFGPINIDKIAPVITTNVDDYGLYQEPKELTFSATDTGGSGLNTLKATLTDALNGITNPDTGAVLTQGVYTLEIVATDHAGNASPITRSFVVFDPTAGFVTGGGWIMSPAGADKRLGNELLAGKATFGFVSKYVKTKTDLTLTGNTEFQFKAGNLNFKSTSYEWLVVNQNGTNAQFKGTGTINGQGSYNFMLWATDDAPDTFRIQITGTGGLVYDNGFGQALDGVSGGGSIVVHTPNKK